MRITSTAYSQSVISTVSNQSREATFAQMLNSKAEALNQGTAKGRTAEDIAGSGNDLSFESIQNSFDEWLAEREAAGLPQERLQLIADSRETFLSVVKRAQEEGGYSDPQSFVQSLSEKELSALQHTHMGLTALHPDEMSTEQAFNLLVSMNQSQDIDRDGYTNVGHEFPMMVFPPRDAPQSFKDAWEESTKDMSSDDVGMMMLSMWMSVQAASVTLNSDGSPGRVYVDGTKLDYKALVDGELESTINSYSYQETDEQRENVLRMIANYQVLRDRLMTA
ncbi:hypothetical protein [Musicola keenii]|uniref:hypothetical protein n=1 Tax=Musicola keenii TaxID=2884250 RepID=UPI00177D59DE|nr:hypothetical protein [Musicola keenii]